MPGIRGKATATLTAAACLGGAVWVMSAAGKEPATTPAAERTIASGATTSGSTAARSDRQRRRPFRRGTPVSAEVQAKVRAAVVKRLPGSTVDRVFKRGDDYVARVRKADGSRVKVTLDAAFAVTAVSEAREGKRPGRGEPVSAEVQAKVRAAVVKRLPGSTVDRVFKRGDGYVAAVRKADGSRVFAVLDAEFAVTRIGERPRHP